MDAPVLSAEAPLPDDVPTLQAMVRQLLAEVACLRTENAELQGKLEAALKHRFGRRSERRPKAPVPPNQPPPKGKATPHGRTPLPEHLPRREVVLDLTDAEKLCPCCGQPRARLGGAAPRPIGPGTAPLLRPPHRHKTH